MKIFLNILGVLCSVAMLKVAISSFIQTGYGAYAILGLFSFFGIVLYICAILDGTKIGNKLGDKLGNMFAGKEDKL